MPNTFFGLNIGTLGIHTANVQLNVTANNTANEHTEGYSRQKASQQATTPLRSYQKYGMIGSGVEVTSIYRTRNEYYDVKYQENQTRYGENNARYYYLFKVEDLFNEEKVEGFTREFDRFYEASQEMSKDPSNITTKTTYMNYAESLLEYMQEIKKDLQLEQEDLNAEVSNNVSSINSYAQEIASLNKQINVVELTGANANELRDRRSVILDKLSQIVEISTSEDTFKNGKTEFTVKIGGATLVDNYNYFTLKVESRDEMVHDEDTVGLYDIKWSYGDYFNPTSQGIGGTLKGLLEIRDGNNGVQPDDPAVKPVDYKGIPYYIEQINVFLKEFTDTVNEVHQAGENVYGESAADTPLFIYDDLSKKYIINPDVKEDPNLLATAYKRTDGVSQNDLLDDLYKTKSAVVYNGGTAVEFLRSVVTDIAVDTRKNKHMMTNYENMATAIDNQRLSVMGVDKDEEAANLMKYQEMFELCSKVISVMAEIYNTLIRETGV